MNIRNNKCSNNNEILKLLNSYKEKIRDTMKLSAYYLYS